MTRGRKSFPNPSNREKKRLSGRGPLTSVMTALWAGLGKVSLAPPPPAYRLKESPYCGDFSWVFILFMSVSKEPLWISRANPDLYLSRMLTPSTTTS